MKVEVTIRSQQLTRAELQQLIQGIRDCEQKAFPDKEISILIKVPELSQAECQEILTSIKPPYKYGPRIISLAGEGSDWPEFGQYVRQKYPELDEDLITMIENLIACMGRLRLLMNITSLPAKGVN